MEIVGNVVFGIVAAVFTTALLTVPGLALGGAIGIVVRHFASPTRRVVRYVVIGAWLALCLAATSAPIIQTETATHHGAFDGFGEVIVLWIGFASALGGTYALYRTMPLGRRAA